MTPKHPVVLLCPSVRWKLTRSKRAARRHTGRVLVALLNSVCLREKRRGNTWHTRRLQMPRIYSDTAQGGGRGRTAAEQWAIVHWMWDNGAGIRCTRSDSKIQRESSVRPTGCPRLWTNRLWRIDPPTGWDHRRGPCDPFTYLICLLIKIVALLEGSKWRVGRSARIIIPISHPFFSLNGHQLGPSLWKSLEGRVWPLSAMVSSLRRGHTAKLGDTVMMMVLHGHLLFCLRRIEWFYP